MGILKRLGASALALGVAAAGLVIAAPLASAHTGTLETSYVCQTDGTYKITYAGTTTNVPASGDGHEADLRVGEIEPSGTHVSGAPAKVIGNTGYSFTQVVPGDATYAQATAFLVWGDGERSDPIGKVTLQGTCQQPPKGGYAAECTATGAKVVVGDLSSGTQRDVVWTLTYGDQAKTVVSGETVIVTGGAQLDLSYKAGTDESTSVKHDQAPYACPPVQPPNGGYAAECTATGAKVVVGDLSSGTQRDVVWTLTHGDQAKTVVSGETVIVTGGAQLDLSYKAGTNESTSVKHDQAPYACPSVVPATGSFSTVCTATGANVVLGALDAGTKQDVVWTLHYNDRSKTVASGETVAVPAAAALALMVKALGEDSRTVQSGTAPAACPEVGEVVKTSVPATGAVVAPGQTIAYTVTVTNTGQVPITNAPVVDTLPGSVTAVSSSVSDSGVVSSDGRTINWTVSLGAGVTKTLTYSGLVATNAPAGTSLVNKATFLLHESTTTHPVGARSLAIEKAVTPVGGAQFGDPLTYTLKVTAGGDLGQTDVTVSDFLPGYKPGRRSGTTSYVDGSAGCDADPCEATYDAAAKQVTWALGPMAPGDVRTVTFQVTIDTPEVVGDDEIGAVDIFNSAVVASNETPGTPSNEVITPVTTVEGTKFGPEEQPPTTTTQAAPLPNALPHTGAGLPVTWTLGAAAMFLLMGAALLFMGRKAPVRLPRG